MSLEQFTYSYIFKISQSVYYTMNQLYMICTSTKSFIFLFLSQKSSFYKISQQTVSQCWMLNHIIDNISVIGFSVSSIVPTYFRMILF